MNYVNHRNIDKHIKNGMQRLVFVASHGQIPKDEEMMVADPNDVALQHMAAITTFPTIIDFVDGKPVKRTK